MVNYPNYIKPRPMYNNSGERFIFPFLLGGLAGGAAVGLTRPRPVYVNPPMMGPGYYPPVPPRPYANYSYSYYVPYGN